MELKIKPYFRYLGGKYKVMDKIADLMPKDSSLTTLVEPFAGSCQVYLGLRERGIVSDGRLNDNSKWVILLHKLIRDNPDLYLEYCKKYRQITDKMYDKPDVYKAVYYKVREEFNKNINDDSIKQIMRFAFIIKMGFNGLVRFKKDGSNEISVAPGSVKLRFAYEEDNIRLISSYFKDCQFYCEDYTSFIKHIVSEIDPESSLVFYDPPYLPTTFTMEKQDKDFNVYSPGTFSFKDIRKIRVLFDYLSKKGIKQMLTINDQKEVLELFESDYNIHRVEVKKIKPGTAAFTGATTELWITNY